MGRVGFVLYLYFSLVVDTCIRCLTVLALVFGACIRC
jgi:hypothetical protein